MTLTDTSRADQAPVTLPPDSRFSALVYDPFLWWAERSGMADRRAALLAGARGSVLELGAGTGLNLVHYPHDLERLVLAEPQRHMARRLERRRARLGRQAEIIDAAAEALPFDADSFDTVVVTLVLCTVAEPHRALAEIHRVLRPGGSLLFLEHVRSDDARLARWQDRLHGPWRSFADGCNCNRTTLQLARDAGSLCRCASGRPGAGCHRSSDHSSAATRLPTTPAKGWHEPRPSPPAA